ncbi:MAG: transporter [Alphaproteobacteria bacterium]|nr:transporter [Alphaproteobacteria bacterium]
MILRYFGFLLSALLGWLLASPLLAEEGPQIGRQSLEDAWWTGPVITMSAASMPKGHSYFEPYLYSVRSGGNDHIRSRTYMLYGVTDRLTAGLIPVFGYNRLGDGESSSSLRMGDLSLILRYQLTKYSSQTYMPDTSLALEWSMPTGRHDRLKRLGDGLGAGTNMLTARVLAQEIFWAPNGRIIRARLGLSRTFAGNADVENASVYGTPDGFIGRASPGSSFTIDNSWEYSLTRNWVLAVDLSYSHTARTKVKGILEAMNYETLSGTADTFAIAPAVEYSWSATKGILAGVRIIPKSHGTPASITPVVALSLFY